jgi:hypothetical protein
MIIQFHCSHPQKELLPENIHNLHNARQQQKLFLPALLYSLQAAFPHKILLLI